MLVFGRDFMAVRFSCVTFVFSVLVCSLHSMGQVSENLPSKKVVKNKQVEIDDAIAVGVEQLLKIQNDDGSWPYEGVYRVRRQIPVGYRIGGTAICCEALLYATPASHEPANQSIMRGVDLILEELEHPLMEPSQKDQYDVRVWGHTFALDLFCRLKHSGRFPKSEEKTKPWIEKLTRTLLFEELKTGGWNYANRRAHAAFVTVPVVQALLWSRGTDQKVPAEVFQRAIDALNRSRNSSGAFTYSGNERESRPTQLPGSIARAAGCELVLELLGANRDKQIQAALDAFHKHWIELEKRRKKTGTHVAPYGVAPYYFYYGHRYVAQAIAGLGKADRPAEYERFNAVLFKTRDEDGTWNDRVFDRSKAYGTAMAMMALLAERVPLPPKYADTENPMDFGN